MGISELGADTIDRRIGQRLKQLRNDRAWSLDELAKRSGVSRATLSRLENADVSATTSVLSKLCSAYGLSLSRLLYLVEGGFAPLVRRDAQPVWLDPEVAFQRRAVSPPAPTLAGEAVEATLAPGTQIAYDGPSKLGSEHHLVLLDGRLRVTVDGVIHDLTPGDCLRYQLFGPSAFETPGGEGARYLLFTV